MPEEGKYVKIHIVQKGETLWNIAQKYGVNFDELKKMNAQLSNPEMIMPGMKIKVPSGIHVKKEMPKHVGGIKEAPKVEHPYLPKKEAPLPVAKPPKEKPKEVPYHIYQPVMPEIQPLPEIDINNYYMVNMKQQQVNQQVQHEHHEESPMQEMPVYEEVAQPMYYYPPMAMPCYDPCYNPCYDPCYPHSTHMMPMHHVQGMMPTPYPMMHPQVMPSMLPGMPVAGYQAMPQHFDEESSSDHGHHHHHMHHGHVESSENWQYNGAAMMPTMEQTAYFGNMPMIAQPHMPQQAFTRTGHCGCDGSSYLPPQPYGWQGQPMPTTPFPNYGFTGYPAGTAMPATYAMPVRHDEGNGDE